MARIKRDQDRQQKRDEIVAAARTLFINDGYESTSMSRLATAAGVAPNTIYWYFKDKDEVLVAVIDEEFSARMIGYFQLSTSNITERLLWFTNQLIEVRHLVSTIHSRLDKSSALNVWHERFHNLTEGILREEMRQAGLADATIEARVKICVFTIEGLLTHQVPEDEKRKICAELSAF